MAVGRQSFPFGRPGLFSRAMLELGRGTGYVEDVYFPGGKCWQIPLLWSQVLNHTTARHRLVTSRARGTINYTHLNKETLTCLTPKTCIVLGPFRNLTL